MNQEIEHMFAFEHLITTSKDAMELRENFSKLNTSFTEEYEEELKELMELNSVQLDAYRELHLIFKKLLSNFNGAMIHSSKLGNDSSNGQAALTKDIENLNELSKDVVHPIQIQAHEHNIPSLLIATSYRISFVTAVCDR